MRPVPEPDQLKNGTIVAARVEGHGTTLKRFYRRDRVTLKPANSNTSRLKLPLCRVQVQVP